MTRESIELILSEMSGDIGKLSGISNVLKSKHSKMTAYVLSETLEKTCDRMAINIREIIYSMFDEEEKKNDEI